MLFILPTSCLFIAYSGVSPVKYRSFESLTVSMLPPLHATALCRDCVLCVEAVDCVGIVNIVHAVDFVISVNCVEAVGYIDVILSAIKDFLKSIFYLRVPSLYLVLFGDLA